MISTICLIIQLDQLELGSLEPEVVSRGDVDHEAEIDVDNVAELVDHQVGIVPVLELEEVGGQRGACHGLDEVAPDQLEELGIAY